MLVTKLFKVWNKPKNEWYVTDKKGFWYHCEDEQEAIHMVLDAIDVDSLDGSKIFPGVCLAN
jgi:hypothetical protein